MVKPSQRIYYMNRNKVESFTLSEMLVVMIITLIVVGIAFSVLSLVQRQIRLIEKNFQKTTDLSLFEQRLNQDFNEHNKTVYSGTSLMLYSDIDTLKYSFNAEHTLRDNDTLRIKLEITSAYYMGTMVKQGLVDGISISGEKELPDYFIFASTRHDAAHFMN